MIQKRPILAACLVLAVFTTAVLGVPGGRVICVGEGGHLAVAGPHAGDQPHECCCEDRAGAEEKSLAAGESDCSDWSLDAQNFDRGTGQRGATDVADWAVTPPAWLVDGDAYADGAHLSTVPSAPPGGIPRAHLALIAPVILLI